jgi:hypothetical protein
MGADASTDQVRRRGYASIQPFCDKRWMVKDVEKVQ